MNHLHGIRFVIFMFALALMAAGGCLRDCDCDKQKRPLPTPSPPSDAPHTPPFPEDVDIKKPAWDVHTTIPWTTANNNSRHIASCEEDYIFEATATQQLDACRPMNFSQLYDTSREVGRKYIETLKCQQDCPYVHTQEISRKWECTQLPATAPPENIAYSAITYVIRCLKDDVDDIELPYPPPPPVDAPYLPVTDLNINDVVVENGPIDALGCEIGEDNFKDIYVNFTENIVSDCTTDNWDFGPYINRARELAKAHHSRQSCAPDCIKLPIAIAQERWKCTNTNIVEVDIIYTLKCLPE